MPVWLSNEFPIMPSNYGSIFVSYSCSSIAAYHLSLSSTFVRTFTFSFCDPDCAAKFSTDTSAEHHTN
jgi:hypothetical protein